MKVLFCWPTVSGYMASCWRALNDTSEVDVLVLAGLESARVDFDAAIMRGIPSMLLTDNELCDYGIVRNSFDRCNPDVLVVSGWWNAAYRRLTVRAESDLPRIMAMDTPFTGSIRQRLGRWRYPRLFRHIDHVDVPGERSRQMAKSLGFSDEKISTGLYGIDDFAWSGVLEERRKSQVGWPKGFLYAGHLDEVKGFDVLLEAYARYRKRVTEPWPLTSCGKGKLETLLPRPGVDHLGFVQPSELPGIFCRQGVFVLPSRFDAWGVALVEAAAAGLPIVATVACGSSVEVLRDSYNGRVVPPGDVEHLADALVWCHERHEWMPKMGERSRELAGPYGSREWAARWSRLLRGVLGGRARKWEE